MENGQNSKINATGACSTHCPSLRHGPLPLPTRLLRALRAVNRVSDPSCIQIAHWYLRKLPRTFESKFNSFHSIKHCVGKPLYLQAFPFMPPNRYLTAIGFTETRRAP